MTADAHTAGYTPTYIEYPSSQARRDPVVIVLSAGEPIGIEWRRVNHLPFEFAMQKGPHGDEFVKLLDGSCLRRPLPTSAPTLAQDNKRLREALEGLVRSIGEKWDGETERRRANALSPNIEEALESARRALEGRG
jgi:hypothetical protein